MLVTSARLQSFVSQALEAVDMPEADVRMSNHAGPAGLYARMPLAHGKVKAKAAAGESMPEG